MTLRFHVLASGSSGNACVVEANGFGVLIDFGLSPRQLAPRMRRCGITWDNIHAVLLTHPHSDHWQAATLSHLAKLGLPIYCHREQRQFFDPDTRAFQTIAEANLFRDYEPGEQLKLQPEFRCLPIPVAHDGAMTCGFRIEGQGWALGYLADLGSWTPALVEAMIDVDLLALEFNHDVAMQLGSGRHPTLIRRVLGDHGHLSNKQAADLLTAILERSAPGRVRHLVQLHLSQQCNRPDLAHATAQQVLDGLGIDLAIFTADQMQRGTTIDLARPRSAFRAAATRRPGAFSQPLLPFAD